ncbi:pyridoxine kinase [Sporobacter termitidis DSM 10068]|uniref:pyridoxal kinase n=1 Tax=Sporobacter termitidis DSM 10068 TaxID=1123282 RepID=A0A1M5ZBL3_9FIRM|nr:pyridoxamine kinase [Sporobacter termitidis]SHI21549.1 pyridoxine kinase [Sporobacter termitidis DSM 10068]
MSRQKRVAAIHDISCFGKCSLTVALPIISSAGIETCAIPTAVLSTHTGGFDGYTYRDLTDDILPVASHWQALDLRFDAVYTGYLGSFKQIDIVSEIFDKLKTPDGLIVVDPVMADNGRLYANFSADFPEGMKKLCRKADIVVPNITEACLLTGRPYRPGPYDTAFIEDLLSALAAFGPKQVVLTGVSLGDAQLGAASLDTAAGKLDYAFSPRVEGFYHGTGDVFASALVAALLTGHGLSASAAIAVEFTYKSIERTKAAGTDNRFGVNFEAGLGELANILNK